MLKRLVTMTVLILGMAAPRAEAAIIELNTCGTLAEVILNGCTVGDKVFSNFQFDLLSVDPTIVDRIEVIGIMDDALGANAGLRLQGIAGSALLEGGDEFEALLSYRVAVQDPSAFLITDLHLRLDAEEPVSGWPGRLRSSW